MDKENALIYKAYGCHRVRKGKVVWEIWKDIGDGDMEIPPLPDHLKHLAPYLPELVKLLRPRVFLDRTPLGGFDGQIRLLAHGVDPNAPKQPQRPGQDERPDDTDGDDEP
jgi:hypothetical protein